MNIINIFLCLMTFQKWCLARDSQTFDFVKEFVSNERKPTILITNYLCWQKNIKVNLFNKISKVGIRSSISLRYESKYHDHNHQLLFLIDLNCPYAEEIIKNATSKQFFRSPYRWLVITNTTSGPGFQALVNSPLLTDSDVVLAERTGAGFKLIEFHKPSFHHSMQFTLRGYYNGTLVDVRPHRELFRRRRDLMGHSLIMANVIQDSNTTRYHLPREDRLEPQHDSISKICWMNMKLACLMLNATPQYIFSYRYGYQQNGQWSGMIWDLKSGRADLGTNCLINRVRLDMVDYTETLAPFRVGFILRQPPLSYVTNIYSLPFSRNVWLAIVACAALSTITMYLVSKFEAKDKLDATQMDGGIGDAFLLTMSAVSQQGCVIEPKKASGRIAVWIFFTALMALYAAYSANIVVLLQASSDSIKTLAQLSRSKVTIAAYDVDYNRFIFRISDGGPLLHSPVHNEIIRKILNENDEAHFYDINEGVERIRQGLFAFHAIFEPMYRRIEETFLETEKCDLTEVNFLNVFHPLSPIQKGSPYKELLRVVFKQIRECGIRSVLVNRLQVPKPRCTNSMSSFSSVGLLHLKPVMIFIMYGIGVSIVILFLEIILFKLNTRHIPAV